MKAEQLSDALNQLPDDILKEADESRRQSPVRRRPAWQRWGALAACLALVLLAGSRLLKPRPPAVAPPGSSGPSQPVPADPPAGIAGEELPLITITDNGPAAMGYEGYLAYSIDELGGANPWTQDAALTTLPVFQNPLTYDRQYRVQGADTEKMRALLLRVAGQLGIDTETTPITDNAPTEDYKRAITEKLAAVGEEVPEGYFDPTTLIIQAEGIKIEVDQTLTARIDFDPPVPLPGEYRFMYDATSEEMADCAKWLSERYAGLLSDLEVPVLDQGMADRNIYGERSFDVEYYDGAGSLEEQIVSYSFNRVALYNNDEGRLFLARVYAPDLSHKLGDYPVITPEEARELLLAGNYATSVPCAMPGEERIAKVELVYRTGSYEGVWLPYYRFLVELPEEYRPAGTSLLDFGAYYVPAVEGRYIANMPLYGGEFNAGPSVTEEEGDDPTVGIPVPGQK